MTNTLIMMLIIVFASDLTDFPTNIKKLLWRVIYGKRKYVDYRAHLIDCSLCQTFWATLAYVVATSQLSISMIGWCCFLAYMTVPAKDILMLIRDIISKITNEIYEYFQI